MQSHNNWWYTLNEVQKQNIWFNEVVTKWWSDLSLSDKMALSNKVIGTIQYGKLTKEHKIELYKNTLQNGKSNYKWQ